ncbi:Isoleucine--tRNA ligase [uncultured archaeon]|nr:Isoleucine--tRNA ligase [uncultured archaeon]
MKNKGLLEKQEKLMHSVPISERSGAEIEFVEMPEYYLKQLELKDEIKKIAKKINFYPPESRELLEKWVDSISMDWPISRRRFYATPIPLWNAEKSGKKYHEIPREGKYYQPWKEKVPTNAEVWCEGKKQGLISEKKFSDMEWKGEERVFDTWIDSSISELFILKYGENKEFFKKAYPVSLRPQGKEIVRTWLYYTLLRGYLETGKAPFNDVWIHQHILDEKGMKMSKSKGNIISPQELLKDFGAEAIRLWSAIEGDLSKGDLKCSKERIRAEVKTINKIINVSKFIMQFEKPIKFENNKLTDTDALFIDYANELAEFCDKSYEKYDFYNPSLKLRNFLWEVLASHYLEIVKSRAYNEEGKFTKGEEASARHTLHYLLEKFMILIYPIIPQVTTTIMKEKGRDLLSEEYPKEEKTGNKENAKVIEKIMEFNKMVWKKKQEKSISLREAISGIEIPKELEKYSKDLRAAHKI